MGDVYFKQNNYTTSESYYKKAESLVKEPSCLLGWIYNGLAGIRLKQKLWKEAEMYLAKTENIAEKYNHLELKKGVYANINDYYEGIEDADKASIYAVKYVKVYEEINAKNNAFINEKLRTDPQNNRSGKINIAKNIAIIILCVALGGLFLFFRLKQKKQRSKIRTIIRSQQKLTEKENKESEEPDFSNISVEEIDDKENETGKKRTESLMTSETETKLLELLNDFEKGNLYNNKNMSLPFLSGELNTNTKYLSYVINQHKSADFKAYINRLRINYIIDKIIKDEKYRQYKISILAEECGFSSHSKFASVFKAVTDFSPSAYIKLLDTENQLDKNIHFQENN
ncbi:helix-turn-helix domain-containing protein [Chryseobacterium sp. G0201]|uniref:helix-turn-helix domain-containing protein n=1 Tax=Chryseobacterium sp. G0201 TaxID=2487065 RepID=UPI000F4DF721|nr:helix-turn-helix domain-containing protein [Chryseobacterium sp. G0201]AZA51574.1 helix-turn-helix domain-containing protein [Chryseobacterium sp. G0201]